jgi:hypothetical protein
VQFNLLLALLAVTDGELCGKGTIERVIAKPLTATALDLLKPEIAAKAEALVNRLVAGTYYWCACRKSNADILVVQPAENWAANNLPGPFDGTRERGILLQGEMRAGAVVICHVRQQQVAEVAFAEHDNVVEAFSSDRTDQPFGNRGDVG